MRWRKIGEERLRKPGWKEGAKTRDTREKGGLRGKSGPTKERSRLGGTGCGLDFSFSSYDRSPVQPRGLFTSCSHPRFSLPPSGFRLGITGGSNKKKRELYFAKPERKFLTQIAVWQFQIFPGSGRFCGTTDPLGERAARRFRAAKRESAGTESEVKSVRVPVVLPQGFPEER